MKKLSILFATLAVSAMAFAADNKVAVLDGSVLSGTATTTVTTVKQDGIDYSMGIGVKYQTSKDAKSHFGSDKSIFFPKSGTVIKNITPFGDGLVKLEVYANYGASTSAAVSIAYSDTLVVTEPKAFDTILSLATLDHVYELNAKVAGKKYIYVKNHTSKNAQIQLRATYAPKVSEPTLVERIELENDGKDTIEVGDKLDLNKLYTIIPDTATDQRVDFSIVYGGEFISLKDGVVTANAAGDAQVAIMALDSLNTGTKISGTFNINVKAAKLNTCAEVNAAAKDDVLKLNTVTVSYVNGANVYVQDASGSTLVYMYESGLKAGDVVSGIKGTASPYNGLPELKPTNTAADWTITAGEAPAFPDATAVPAADQVNKIFTYKGVTELGGSFVEGTRSDLTGKFLGEDFNLYSNFKQAATFDNTKIYDVVGAVGIIDNTDVRVFFISATDVTPTRINEVAEKAAVKKMIVNGQVVFVKDGKMFNALGVEL